MHIPDGYLSPQTYGPCFAAWILLLWVALKKIRKDFPASQIPYMSMAAAFSFLIQMFNLPVPGGTTGHAVGASVIALMLGPWTAVVAVSVALVIQAFVFGDGGITALGANGINMAVIMPFVSYGVFRIVNGKSRGGFRQTLAAFLSGYVGLTAAALATAVLFGIQPLIAAGADGRPLYAPYPLSITVPAMALEHLLLFSVVEGMMTVMLLRYVLVREPSLDFALRNA